MRQNWSGAIAAVLARALGGCGSDRTGPSTGGQGVTVGNILFRSNANATTNPAVDTVAVGATLEWTWVRTGAVSPSVRSTGTPGFSSSTIMTGDGTTYAVTFTVPGTYSYDCAVHGAAMTGRVVVR